MALNLVFHRAEADESTKIQVDLTWRPFPHHAPVDDFENLQRQTLQGTVDTCATELQYAAHSASNSVQSSCGHHAHYRTAANFMQTCRSAMLHWHARSSCATSCVMEENIWVSLVPVAYRLFNTDRHMRILFSELVLDSLDSFLTFLRIINSIPK